MKKRGKRTKKGIEKLLQEKLQRKKRVNKKRKYENR